MALQPRCACATSGIELVTQQHMGQHLQKTRRNWRKFRAHLPTRSSCCNVNDVMHASGV